MLSNAVTSFLLKQYAVCAITSNAEKHGDIEEVIAEGEDDE